jgi:hypothetical protein
LDLDAAKSSFSTFQLDMLTARENRNPKPESRRKPESGNPKKASGEESSGFAFRTSAFFRASGFGLRIFGSPSVEEPKLCAKYARANLLVSC